MLKPVHPHGGASLKPSLLAGAAAAARVLAVSEEYYAALEAHEKVEVKLAGHCAR